MSYGDKNNPASINIHGFLSTPQFSNYSNEWLPYVKRRINNWFTKNPNKKRMTISQFLSRPQFLESKINNLQEEQKRVNNKFKDPLPPYDNITEPQYRTGGGSIIRIGEREKFTKFSNNGLRRSKDYIDSRQKRREWGFRENILQGYPEYKPFMIEETSIIVGIVTAGSGVFGGIPSVDTITKSDTELYRMAERGVLNLDVHTKVPNGLCFIQDESGGLGITLGTDPRYLSHPKIYRENFSNPYILDDQMHAGSIVIPKADYRQFLRVGDLVIIEVGTNFKYWNSTLGFQPRYWEELWMEEGWPDRIKELEKEMIEVEKSGKLPPILEEIPLPPINRSSRKKRPYIDNWGAEERPLTNTQFVLPKNLGRDTVPKGPYSFGWVSTYPYGEEHPWSTGTPIPLNSGMPYIMIEQFIVDETERYSPTPLIITASQLRGFPDPRHWRSIIKGFDTPKKLGLIDPNLAWYKETSENPKLNPWIKDPSNPNDLRGSDFKGMLVQLKNVRFVYPPKKGMMKISLAPKNVEELTDTINERFSENPGFIKISPELINQYTYLENLMDDTKNVYEELKNGKSLSDVEIRIFDETVNKTITFTGFSNMEQLNLMLYTKHGIDARGFRFETPVAEIQKFLFNVVDDTNIVSDILVNLNDALDISSEFTTLFTDLVSSFGYEWISGLYNAYETISSIVDSPAYDETEYDFTPYYKWDFVYAESPFPRSVDAESGGYWWANPDIPLTNARSHFKDDEISTSPGPTSQNTNYRSHFTQLKSSTTLSEVEDRYVKDLGYMYSSSYAPFAEEWKPSTMIDGNLVMNVFEPIPSDLFFEPDTTYYVVDEHNVIIPIRINSNTEISRFNIPIPTGPVDITGIAWQFSLGKPGMEWERESFCMQIWPRFASDISKRSLNRRISPTEKSDDNASTRHSQRMSSVRLQDKIIDFSKFNDIPLGKINDVNCEMLTKYLSEQNSLIKNSDSNQILNGCDGLENGQEVYYIVVSDLWGQINRTFHFYKDKNGNCNCQVVPKGTNTLKTGNKDII